MTKIQKLLDSWENQGSDLAALLEQRLEDIDRERTEIITKLRKVKGKGMRSHSPSQNGGRGNFSSVAKSMFDILREAGPNGLTAKEVCAALTEELGDDIRKEIIATQLSRHKRAGRLSAIGQRGSIRYIYTEPEGSNDTEDA